MAGLQNLYKSVVLIKGHTKIGIIGYLTPDTKFLAPRNNVEYEDEIVAIRREAAKLKERGVNIIIALGHSGFDKDKEIAEKVRDLDLVIGGHTNTFLWNSNTTDEVPEIIQGRYPYIVVQPSGRKVPVVQAYAYTKYIGKLHMVFDSEGEMLYYEGTPILLNQKIPRDPELLQLVQKYQEKVNLINNEVIGKSTTYLIGDDVCRIRECKMGNLINDAMLYYSKFYGDDKPTIAITQGGRIRSSITRLQPPPFEVTRGDLINVMPFTDSLTILTMNGTILLKALEHSVEEWKPINPPGQFIQFSGMRVKYDLANPPGTRVVEAKAICSNCGDSNMRTVQDSYEYKVLTSTFLADGGDNYTMFQNLPKEILSYNEVVCLLHYFKMFSPIETKLDGRITLLNEDKFDKTHSSSTREPRMYTSNAVKPGLNIISVLFLAYKFAVLLNVI